MKKAFAVLSALLAIPCHAGELDFMEPSTQLYFRIPLGPAASAQDRKPSFGLAFRNRYDGPAFMLDSRQVDYVMRSYEAGLFGAIEPQWLIVGAVAVGAAVVIGTHTQAESNQQQQQAQQKQQVQQQQQQQQQQPNQGPCTC